MACPDCKKKKLNPCGNCDYTVPTDCVEYTGDVLSFKDNNTKAGSNRTLTEILTDLSSYTQCNERPSKTIQGDYSIQAEDACKIILLDGSVTNIDVTYTIELPTSEDFINKVIVFKNISQEGDPSGTVTWEFDTQVKYNWETDTYTMSYNDLCDGLHKMVYLTFVKVGVNYMWIPINCAGSGGSSSKERIEVPDASLQNNWVTYSNAGLDFTVYYVKEGNKVTLEGAVLSGDDNTTVFTLPAGYRPFNDKIFGVTGYSTTINPYNVYISASTGNVVISSDPTGVGSITDRVSFDNISFYIN